MRVPNLEEAKEIVKEAECLNPGPWVQHVEYAAKAAYNIAKEIDGLDENIAYVLGYLHDIGRRESVSSLRHIIDGYNYLMGNGYDDAARICLTHSFPCQNLKAYMGKWDCTEDELKFIKNYLDKVEYNDYDKLIQLCDALALPTGFSLIEKRLLDVVIRHGVSELFQEKVIATLDTQKYFEKKMGKSIYSVLDGVVGNTFNAEIG